MTVSETVVENVSEVDLTLAAYNYELPEDRIAQEPVVPRHASRLLIVSSPTEHQHGVFQDLLEVLRPGDLLVINNTRVIPARLHGQKPDDGAKVELLLLERRADGRWLTLVKPGRRLKVGAIAEFHRSWPVPDSNNGQSRAAEMPALRVHILEVDVPTGGRIVEFEAPDGADVEERLHELGEVPLPPYIKNSHASAEQYQTVYAQEAGSVAAPTAGLHFTPELLAQLQSRGIEHAVLTLHIGVGTFRPVKSDDIRTHTMHEEWVSVSQETIDKIRQTQARGGRVIAVGTTVARSLESAAHRTGQIEPFEGKTDLYIYPGYQWKVVEGMITNFHLPRSSLMIMISALIGRQRLLDLYQEAIATGYRFYSFGDAMLILPGAKI